MPVNWVKYLAISASEGNRNWSSCKFEVVQVFSQSSWVAGYSSKTRRWFWREEMGSLRRSVTPAFKSWSLVNDSKLQPCLWAVNYRMDLSSTCSSADLHHFRRFSILRFLARNTPRDWGILCGSRLWSYPCSHKGEKRKKLISTDGCGKWLRMSWHPIPPPDLCISSAKDRHSFLLIRTREALR